MGCCTEDSKLHLPAFPRPSPCPLVPAPRILQNVPHGVWRRSIIPRVQPRGDTSPRGVNPPRPLPRPRCLDLVTAVRLGDEDTVTLLCRGGRVNLDSAHRGATPLGIAVAKGSIEMVTILLVHGANVNMQWRDPADRVEPPLVTASRLGHNHIVDLLLLQPNINIDAADFYGRTAVWVAVEGRRPGIVSRLVKAGCQLTRLPVGVTSKSAPCSLLHLTTRSMGYIGGQEIAILLLQAGVNPGLRDNDGRSPLYWAIENNNTDVAEELISAGCSPWNLPTTSKGKEGPTPLVAAARKLPASLQNHCRNTVRQAVFEAGGGRRIVPALYQLPLPNSIVSFLAMGQQNI